MPCVTRVRLPLALVLLTVVCAAPAIAQTRPTRTVLTIHTGSEDFPANPVLDAAIREALGSRPEAPVAYFAEYLETDQFGEDEARATLGNYIREKYRGRRIDVVIAVTSAALKLVLDRRSELFPDVPIVYGGLGVLDEAARRAAGVAAVRIGRAYSQTLSVALTLHPGTERVFVIANSPNTANVDAVHAELETFSDRLQITYIKEKTLADMLTAVRAVPPRSVILYIWHRSVGTGDEISPIDLARFVAEASPVPVYGTVDSNIGTGIVGGVVRGTSDTGTRLGHMARMILDGTRAEDIPLEPAPSIPTFDWRQLRRWGVDESRLPPQSHVAFRTPTTWEAYRMYFLLGLAVVVAQLVAIAGLLVQRAKRRVVEETLVKREGSLRRHYERTRHLAGRLINAQEAARQELARDLHDDVCQQLVYVSMGVATLKGSSGSIQDPTAQQAFESLERDTQGMFDGIRRLSHELHPPSLRLLGVGPALKAHCADVAKRHGVEVHFEAHVEFQRLHPDVATCFYRIAQEALRNGLVHGRARHFTVSLSRLDDRLEMTIADDGQGFDPDEARGDGSGLGLVSMEERAHAIGGGVRIESAPGRGTTVVVRGPASSYVPAKPSEAFRDAGVGGAAPPTPHAFT